SNLEEGLALERLDADLFRSKEELWRPSGARGIFGGTVISQCLLAAINTVPEGFTVHSLHGYFILAGDNTIPVLYQVEHIREGKSYTTRTVQARQRGRCIFTMTASFHRFEQSELTHQTPIPKVAPPEQCETMADLVKRKMNERDLQSTDMLKRLINDFETDPIDMRTVPFDPEDLKKEPHERRVRYWAKCKEPIKSSLFHMVALAYMSDSRLIGAVSTVNNVRRERIAMMVSLDHTVHFHSAHIKVDDWVLFDMRSPWSGAARGVSECEIYSKDGTLIATVKQEGAVRLRPNSK
ncbi:hypothetical protein CANCADRAFT_15543, partial [Tortispora caseinolytica NRRL Y-17796]